MKQVFGDPYNPIWKGGARDWYDYVGAEMQVTWGLHQMFKLELPELRFMRGQTIWLEGTLDDLRERRNAILGMARSVIGNNLTGELEALWPMLGIDTASPRLANAICHAYVNPPIRTFSTDDSINDGFDDLYDKLNVNSVLDSAYRSALFTNMAFCYWDGRCFQVLTPEYFRLTEDIDGGRELWMVRRESDGLYFDVWNDEVHTVRLGASGAVCKVEKNPYGTLPGVFLRFNQSQDTYGAGITEAADLNCANGLITLFERRIALYQGFSIGIATNFGESIKAGQKISPGSILTPNNSGGDASTAPKLEYVTPDGKFAELGEYRDKRMNSFLRNQDLPGFLVDASGVPPTGVALQVAERQINARRRRDQNALRECEKDMAAFVAMLAQLIGRETLELSTFGVKFADPETFNSPEDSYAFDRQLAVDGFITPSALVQKYFGSQRGMTDEAAVALIKKNQAMFSFLTPEGSKDFLTPIEPTPDASTP